MLDSGGSLVDDATEDRTDGEAAGSRTPLVGLDREPCEPREEPDDDEASEAASLPICLRWSANTGVGSQAATFSCAIRRAVGSGRA